MNTRVFASLIFCFMATAATAGTWTQIEANADETVFVDASSIKVVGDDVEVRVLRTYVNTQLNLLDGEWYAFRSQVATYAIACKQGKLGYIDWVLHHGAQGKGRVLHKGKVVGVLEGDTPASQGEKVLVANVCNSDVALGMRENQVMAQSAQ